MIEIELVFCGIPDCNGVMAADGEMDWHFAFDAGRPFGQDKDTVSKGDGFRQVMGD